MCKYDRQRVHRLSFRPEANDVLEYIKSQVTMESELYEVMMTSRLHSDEELVACW